MIPTNLIEKMPLIVEGKIYNNKFVSAVAMLETCPKLKHSTEHLLKQEPRQFDSLPKTVYVYQREIAATGPNDDFVDILGSDDATTCHILILRHAESGVSALSHFDGCNTKQGVQRMLQAIERLTDNSPTSERIEAHVLGGFCDARNSSAELTCELIAALQAQASEIHLLTLCCTEINNVVKDGINWPIHYGFGIDVKTSEVFPAEFEDKGPDCVLRSARIFGGFHEVMEVYSSKTGEFMIEPFSYDVPRQVALLLQLPDEIFLKYTSTSPLVEKPGYAQKTRETYHFMLSNPRLNETVFYEGKPLIYCLKDGKWKRKQAEKEPS